MTARTTPTYRDQLGLVHKPPAAAAVDTRPMKRWGRADTACLLHVRNSRTAPAELGEWEELADSVQLGDSRVGAAWVRREQTESYWRGWRDAELAASDWRVARATETSEPMSDDWIAYRQALRDIPEQAGFPASVTRPERPQA